MSLKGIDVSSYQGNVNWQQVKLSGIDFAILKVIRKDLNPDRQFENNWKNCKAAGVAVQCVYNYTYATTVQKAINDAKAVLRILNGRDVMVVLDYEDGILKKLGRNAVDIINAYGKVITDAGLEFCVYTGFSFYNTYIKKYASLIPYPFWIARYGKNDGSIDTKYQPQIVHKLIGWQYTSKGKIWGVNGDVDVNLWYKEITDISNDVNVSKRNPYTVPKRLLYRRKIMMYGDDVRWLQFELIEAGELPVLNKKGKSNIDGFLGKDTADATGRFQKKAGIKEDKICGAVTREYLIKQ